MVPKRKSSRPTEAAQPARVAAAQGWLNAAVQSRPRAVPRDGPVPGRSAAPGRKRQGPPKRPGGWIGRASGPLTCAELTQETVFTGIAVA